MANRTARGPTTAHLNSPERRTRCKIGRDIYAAFVAIGRAAGLEPAEIQTAIALDSLLYDKPGQDAETPRKVALSAIGAALTSKKQTDDDADAGWKKAQRDVSHLFCQAYPRVGLAMQIRCKGVKRGDSHMYASRWMIAAGIVAEEFNAERGRILTSSTINREDKGPTIGAALERLALEALGLFDKLDALIVAPDHKPFAVVTQSQAKAFCQDNPKFKTATYTYTPPPDPGDTRPYSREVFDRFLTRMLTGAEKQFYKLAETGSYDEARLLVAEARVAFDKLCASWVKVAGEWTDTETQPQEIGDKRINHVYQNGYDGAEDGDQEQDVDGGPSYPFLGYDAGVNPNGDSDLIFGDLHISDFDPSAEPDPGPVVEVVPPVVALEGSRNFDSALDAAISYVRDGWAIVPCCQFDPKTERCTGPAAHHKDEADNYKVEPCKGKVPLLAGPKDKDGKPKGEGYQAASRDKGLITEWFTEKFKNAGVAIRLDNIYLGDCILLDADVKNGAPGLESYDELDATFDLPATLSAITTSRGHHHIFKLPDDLPADYLGSWTGIMPGLDLKVGVRGLCHVEPTRGKGSIYRWVNVDADIAELPRAACDYLHNLHEQEEQRKNAERAAKAVAHPGSTAQAFDPNEDQSKYVKDMPKSKRRPRLRSIACCLAGLGATVEQIVPVLKFHDSQFKQAGPTNDFKFMARVAEGAVLEFGQGVTR